MKHNSARTWQVTRAEFDEMMLNNAREKGATALEQVSVREFVVDPESDKVTGVVARDNDNLTHQFNGKIVIDASGRDALAVKAFNWREPDPQLNKVAIWSYYENASRDAGMDEGATTVAFIPEKGWFWYIPLHDGRVSVGVVAEKDYLFREGRDAEQILDREIQVNPWVAGHLKDAIRTGPVRVTADYSYRSRFSAREGLVLTGDAFVFLDPVFSSGVFLALKSGSLVADAVDAAIKDNDFRAERFNEYTEKLCSGVEAMRKLVYAFYDEGFNFGKMLKKYPDLRSDLTDCLIGNVDREFTELWNAVSEFADIPGELDYGRPLKKEVAVDS